jgi:hypothetical protein
MSETSEHGALQRVLALPGLIAAGVYRWRGEALEYVGERPGSGWHVHGWCSKWLKVLIGGQVQRVRLHKSRWRLGRRGGTCHNRPPDERAFIGLSSILIVIKLYGWLTGQSGLHSRAPKIETVDITVAPRTMLRWLRRALPDAMEIQQAIREAVIERCEPRPIEQLFSNGLSPPDGLLRRPWKDAASTLTLWRGFAVLFGAAVELNINPALILAEARGRMRNPDFPL